MSWNTIFHLIRSDFKNVKYTHFSILLIPFIISILFTWSAFPLRNWLIRNHSIEDGNLLFAIFVLTPSILNLIVIVFKLGREAKNNYYKQLKMMPISPEEIVTAKMIFSFIFITISGLWFTSIWGIYLASSSHPQMLEIWKVFILFAVIFPVWISIYYLVFFRNGAKDSWSANMILISLFFLSQLSFVQIWIQNLEAIFAKNINLWMLICLVFSLFVWTACWYWAKKGYRKAIYKGREEI